MNQLCYKTIFSKRLGALVAVGEHASNQSKGQGARAALGGWAASAGSRFIGNLAVGFVWVSLAWGQSLPQGAQVVQGTVGVSQTGNQMAITQGSAKAVVNWQSFDIGQNAKVTVLQPSSQSVLLNRVLSDNPTQILGQLQANGQVVLVNPRGIVVGSDGSVSASAFTASSLNISDADFMAGGARYVRDGATGAVVNKGLISVAPGGYVALLGATVQNEGRIVAPQGAVVMGAADAVVLPEALTGSMHVPVGRTGKIKLELTPATVNAWVKNDKSGAIVAEGGQVYLQAAAVHSAVASVFQSGQINTSGAQAGDMHLLADGGRIVVDGQITANSTAPNAKGGSIVIGRDLDTGVLAASTDVSGAGLESQNGFVETSGQWLSTSGTIVKAKEWLLDPYNVTIAASASGTAYTDTYTAGATSIIRATDIATSLNNGTNVTISTGMAGSAGADAGDINVNASITTTGATNNALTLQAARNITFASNQTITRSGTGKLDVTLNSNYGTANSGAIVMNPDSGITSNGGNITLGGGSAGDGSGYAVGSFASTIGTLARGSGVQLVGARLISGSGNIAIRGKGDATVFNGSQFGVLIDSSTRNGSGTGSQLSTTGGHIDITGIAGGNSGSSDSLGIQVDYSSTLNTTGSGNITLTGTGSSTSTGDRNHGMYIARGINMSTVDGNITLMGTAAPVTTAGGNAKGVQLSNNTSLTSTGRGSISITGTGGQGGGANDGVLVDGGGTSTISVTSGNINIIGNGGLGPNWNQGVVIQNTSNITATSGSINITGTGGQGGIYNQAVRIDSGAATITTGTGNINITGTQGSGTSWGFDANSGTNVIRSTSGNVSITADTMQFQGGTNTISAASGTVTLQNKTAGTQIDVGGSDNQTSSPLVLGLQSGELAKIRAANTIIGRNDGTAAGNLTVTSATSLNNLGNVTMLSGNNILVNENQSITKTTGTDATLSLLATNGVEVRENITSSAGKLNVVMNANGLTNGVAASAMTAAQRALSGGVNINRYAIIDANGGDVTLTGTSYAAQGGQQTNFGRGVVLSLGATIKKANNINITGTADNQAGATGYGVYFERVPEAAVLQATGDITITGTLQGAGNGSGVKSTTSGLNPQAPMITAGGKFTLRGNNRASAANTNAAIEANPGGMQVTAAGDIVVQAETNNSASKAIDIASRGAMSTGGAPIDGNASFRSQNSGGVATGNVLIQSNQGSISFDNRVNNTLVHASIYTARTDIVGKNITIDNTGAGMATGAGTAVTGSGGTQGATLGSGSINATTGAITQGAGSATGSGLAGISFSDVIDGVTPSARKVTASGNLNLAGVSSSGVGITSNALLTGGGVNLVGTSSTSTGINLTGSISATSGAATITGTATAAPAVAGTGPGINISSAASISAVGDVTLNGSSANQIGVLTYGSLTSTGANVNVTGTTSGSASVQGLYLQGPITANQNVTLTGTNSNSANPVSAIVLTKAVTATNGTIDVTASTQASAERALQLAPGSSLTTSNKAINISTDTIHIETATSPAATINAGTTGTVTIKNNTAGTAINIGGSDVGAASPGARTLGLTNAELNQITAGNLVVGSSTAGNTTVSAATTTNAATGNITLITGGNVAVNAALNVGTKTLTLDGEGAASAVTQTAAITAANLALLGSNAAFTLNNTSNDVGTLAANAKTVSYYDTNALTVGTVGSTSGITTTGTINVGAGSNLSVTQVVSTTDSSTSALTLNAGVPSAAGTAAGGDILVSGSGSVTVGSGGRATLYTGSVANSTGLTALVGSGSGNFRYKSDEVAPNYASTAPLGSGLYAIYRESPSITVTSGNTMTYGDTVPTALGSVTGLVNGDTVNFTVTGGVNSTSGNIKAGSYSIANTANDLGYTLVTSTGTGQLVVSPKTLTATVSSANYTYSGASYSQAAATTSGLIAGDIVSVSGVATGTNAGTYTSNLTASGTDAGNYAISTNNATLTINKANLTLSGTRTYDATTTFAGQNLTATGVNNETFTVTGSGDASNLASKNVQTNQTLSSLTGLALGSSSNGGQLSNYNDLSTTGSSVSVTAKAATVTATATTSTYSGLSQSQAVSSDFISGDNITVSGNATGTHAGTYTSALSVGGTDAGNYAITVTNADLTIAKANLALSGTRVYDAGTTFAGSNLTATGVNGETFTLTGSGDASNLASKNVQTNQTLSSVTGLALGSSNNGGLTSNYNDISTTGSSVSVTAKAATVTGTATSTTYNGLTQTQTAATTSDFIAGDNIVITGESSGKNAGTYTSALSVGGTDAGNYSVTINNANLTIAKANLALSGTRTYDAGKTFAGQHLTATGVNGETFTLTGSGDASNLASKNVQTNQTLSSVTGLALGSSNNGGLTSNYNDISTTGSSVSVTAKAATVTATATTSTYSGLSQSQAVSSDFISGDNITVSGNATGTHAGTYTSALSVGGTDAGNYAITVTNADLTIAKANLALSGTRTYDAGKTFAGQHLTATGVNGETFTLTGSGDASNLASKNVQTNQTLSSVTGLALGSSGNGGLVSNYNDLSTTGSSVSVTAKTATVNGTATSTTYNGLTQTQTAATTSDFIAGDNIVITGESSGKNAGTYTSALSVGGTDAGNYNVTINNANLTIAKANLTVAMSAQTKTYDGTDSATLASGAITATGVMVNGVAETASVNQTAGTYNSKNVVDANTVTAALASSDFTASSGVDLGNYNLPTTVSGTGAITAKTVSYSGLAVSNKTYDQTTSATLSGTAALGTVAAGASLSTDAKVIAADTVSLSGTAVGTYDSKNVAATNNTVTFSGLSLSGSDASNYTLVQQTSVNGTGTIVAKTLTPTVTASDKTYNGTDTATVSTMGSTDVYAGDTVTFSNTGGKFADRHVAKDGSGNVVGKTVTVSGLAIAGDDASNYALASTSATTTAKITPKALTLAAVTDSKTYDGTTNSTGTVTAAALESMDSVTASQAFASKDVMGADGSTLQVNSGYSVNDSNSGNNYTVSTTTTAGTIQKANLTVTANDDAKFVTRADVTGYRGVSYTGLVNNEDSSVLAGTLSITRTNASTNVGAGTYAGTLTASGLSSGNYNISYVNGNYTIVPANKLLISTSDVSTVYGTAPTYTTTAQYLDGSTDVIHTLSQSNTGNNFTFSDGAGGSVSTVLKPYTVASGTATAAGVSSSGNTVVGNYSILDSNPTITGANFVGSPVYVGTLTVTPKALTAAMAASNKVYDGNVAASVTGSSADILTGDKISFAHTSATFDTKNVGNGKAVAVSGITIGDADAGNYSLQNFDASTTANVTPKAITLSAGSVSKTYDGGLTYTTQAADLTTLTNQLVSGDSVSQATIRYTNKNTANGTKVVTLDAVTLSDGNSGGNYTVTLAGNSTSTITPKAITLSAGSVSKTYDGGLTYTTQAADLSTLTTQLISGDSVSAATISYTDKNAANSTKVVTLDHVTLNDGNSGGNYTVTLAGNSTSTITQKALTAAYTASNKVYDGNNAATVAGASSDIVTGDNVSFANASATFDTKNVGNGKTVSVSGIAISGTDAGNYTLQNTAASTTADVTAKAITLTAGSVSKTYDGGLTYTTQATDLSTLTSQLISGDSVSAATISYTDKNAANGTKVVNLDNVTLNDGNSGGNYTVTLAGNSTSTITQKALTASYTASNKVYDGTRLATVSGASSDIVANDNVTFTNTSATFDTKNVGAGKAVDISGISIGGTDAGNYNLQSTTASTSADVTKKNATITSTTTNVTYNATTQTQSAAVLSGFMADDVSNGTVSATGLATGRNAGSYTSNLSATGTDAGNYNVTVTNADLLVGKKDATITGTTTNVTYNATTQTQNAAVLAGFIDTDVAGGTVSATGLATGRNAGSYTSNLSATGTDAGNYNVTVTNADLVVAKKDATITGTATNVTYNAATQTQNAAVLAGFIDSDIAGGTVSATGLATGRNAGSYTSNLSATGTDAGNYNITVTNADLVVGKKDATITGTATNVTYNATTQTQNAAVLGGFMADDVSNGTVSATGLATGRNAGSYTSSLLATGTDAGNYNVTVTNADLVVGKKDATITGAATNVTYNATTQTQNAAVLAGFIDSDVTGGTVSATGLATGRNAGSYTSSLSATGTDAGNYNVTVTNADLVVGKKDLVLSAVTDTKTYNGTVFSGGVVQSSGLAGTDTANATQSFASKDVMGTNGSTLQVNNGYTVNDSNSGNNYNVTTATATGTIHKANLTVTANADAKFVTQADAAGYNGASYSGLVNGEDSSVLGGTLSITRTNASTNVGAGTYAGTLSASGLSSGNYSISYVTGDYTIVPANQLLIRTNNTSTVYGTTPVYSTTAQYLDGSNVIHTLSQSGTGNSFTFSDGAGGSVSTVLKPYTGLALAAQSTAGQTVVGNYAIKDANPIVTGSNFAGSPVYVGNLTVTPKQVNATANGVSKVYDGTTQMGQATLTLSGQLAGDVVTVTGTGAFSQKDVGQNLSYAFNNMTLQGADQANYVFQGGTSISGNNGQITPATLTFSGTKAADKSYDGNTAAKVVAGTVLGLVGDETLLVDSVKGQFDTALVGKGKSVNVVYGLSNGSGGGLASNYTWSPVTVQADITAPLVQVVPTPTPLRPASYYSRLTYQGFGGMANTSAAKGSINPAASALVWATCSPQKLESCICEESKDGAFDICYPADQKPEQAQSR